MLFKKFTKYQSLGNDFIIFDWHKKPRTYLEQILDDVSWQSFVKKNCDRHFGIGADGILIVTHNQEHQVPEALIFNADGSKAETCLNGLRCVAHYLFSQYQYPESFIVKMGSRLMKCQVAQDRLSGEITSITTEVGKVVILGEKKIKTKVGVFSGYCVDVGNPHFIIFDKKELSWLKQYGNAIESSLAFPNKTNVEFLWEDEASTQDNKIFNLLVYERGCGITLACSSGVAAVVGQLLFLDKIKNEEQVLFIMTGGSVIGWISDGSISLKANSKSVFKGDLI